MQRTAPTHEGEGRYPPAQEAPKRYAWMKGGVGGGGVDKTKVLNHCVDVFLFGMCMCT